MTRESSWSRRATLGGLIAAAGTPGARAQPDAAPAAPPDAGAKLESAFDQATRVSVPVFIDGRGPFPFVVDTGASVTVISAEVAQACALPSAGQAPVHGILAAMAAPMVQVRSLQVGDVRSSHLRLPVLPQNALGTAGLLGVDMLHSRRMVIDFAQDRFELSAAYHGAWLAPGHDTHIASADAPVTVPARFRSGQLIIIDAAAAGHGITAFLDSGSQVTVANHALRELALSSQPRLGAALIHSSLVSATGQRAEADFGPLPGLRIGRVFIDAPLVAFADLHIFELWKLQDTPSILLGIDILRRFDRMVLDFVQKEVTFWPQRRRRAE